MENPSLSWLNHPAMGWGTCHGKTCCRGDAMERCLGVRTIPGCPSPAQPAAVLALPWEGREHCRSGSCLPWGLHPHPTPWGPISHPHPVSPSHSIPNPLPHPGFQVSPFTFQMGNELQLSLRTPQKHHHKKKNPNQERREINKQSLPSAGLASAHSPSIIN